MHSYTFHLIICCFHLIIRARRPDGLAPRQISKRRALPNIPMTISKIASLVAFAVLFSVGALAQLFAPQGRLSLSSTNPVMAADVTAATAIYYDAYAGANVPVNYLGAWSNNTLTLPVTLTLNSTQQTSGNIYDIFAFNPGGGSVQLGIGPAWTSLTSRGSGAGSTAIQQDSVTGFWVNSNAIVAYNGTTWWNPNAGRATYLGSVYMTGNGETSVTLKPAAAAGGSDNVIGIWNAYNRVSITSLNRDSNNQWTEGSSVGWEAADTSNSNRVTWVDGLQQTSVLGRYTVLPAVASGTSAVAFIGVDLDSTTATPNLVSDWALGNSAYYSTLTAEESFPPQMGVHYMQAMQNVGGSSTIYFLGEYPYGYENLMLKSEY
jgi:hypothetical protein